MITLNILPEKLKNDINLTNTYKYTKRAVNTALVFAAIFCAALLGTQYLLQSHLKNLGTQNSEAVKVSDDYSKKVKSINSQIAYIKKLQDGEADLLSVLYRVADAGSPGISIKRLNINKANGTFNISGTAKERKDLLDYKSALEKIGIFDEIKLPIQNMLEQYEINFDISTAIKNYDVK